MFSNILGKRNIEKDIERIIVDASATPTINIVSFIDKLKNDVGVSGTNITVNRLPTGAISEGLWVVIDPWTIECEIRKITAINGITLTMAALTYSHSANDGIIYMTDPIYNVKLYGALGDGTTDDTAKIQAAIDDAVPGSIVYFPDTGPYLINGIIYKESLYYLGTFHGGGTTTLKLKDSATAAAMFIDDHYENNDTTASLRSVFENLTFDGNRTNNTAGHGFIVQGQRNYWLDCVIKNCDEDGIHFTGVTKDSTPITENCVGNRIERCWIKDVDNRGIWGPDGSRFTDGFVLNSVFSGIDGESGIHVQSGSGWKISGNHFWGMQKNAIYVKNGGYCIVDGNYIEGYGATGTLGTYHGIHVHSAAPVVISGNRIRNTHTRGGVTYHGIFIQGSTADDSYFSVANNVFKLNGTETALRIEKSAGKEIYATISGNRFHNCAYLESYSVTTTNITYEGNSFQYATAAPSSGWWPKGMVVGNHDADVREVIGWQCITSGTSGTWRALGNLRNQNGYLGEGGRVYNDAAETIGTGSWTALTFNSERYDIGDVHSIVSNTSRLTVATDGIYDILGLFHFAGDVAGIRAGRILLNGTTIIGETNELNPVAGSSCKMKVPAQYELSATDYVELEVYQTSGDDLNVNAVSNSSPEFMMWRIG